MVMVFDGFDGIYVLQLIFLMVLMEFMFYKLFNGIYVLQTI
jgi:hypothetical protein